MYVFHFMCVPCTIPLTVTFYCHFTNLDFTYTYFQAVKKMGVVGLFTRGLPLRIVMIGTLTGAQWGIYDAFKVFVGL